ncbi:aldo/keto reductase [Companilactobacillus allii]|uniref:Aldo/keto reductase n=1 Tax=Companilactobacillus allii TaxID=1847728 RepID=A0A1P8Q327_9LACO|nr:aldo/keto reductase [Companilactobacillus allii]APX72227.1 aldo/keto reductase [Companilactobacillus allii]USQ69320.1 aldo/keto reductase [Companilactobacillus allii]
MTEQNLPSVALGTWAWGSEEVFGDPLTTKDLKPVVDSAMSAGLNLWDTAAVYGMGASETFVGDLLKYYKREDYLLSTKFTPQIADDSENAMANMLEGSLKRLHTDYVDIYWIHNPADVEKWTPQLIPLVKSGKIKRVGVSNHNLDEIKLANSILQKEGISISAIQNHYSLLYRSSEKAGIIDYCNENNIDFFSYMVLEQGALSGKYNTNNPLPAGSSRASKYNKMLPELEALTNELSEIGKKYDASAAQIAQSWAINKNTLPIIGVTKEKYIGETKQAITIKLTSAEIEKLETLADQANVETKGSWEKPMN